MKKVDEKYFIKDDNVNYNPSIESALSDDETILWKAKPKKSSFMLNSIFKFLPLALIWLGFDTFFIILMVDVIPSVPWFVIIFFVIFFIVHLIPVWVWIGSVVSASRRLKLEEYAFTDRRILIKRGFVGANLHSVSYSSLNSVNLRIGIIERMCKVGDIYIVANNEKYILEDISDPYFIYEKLQKIASDIKTDIIFPNAYRPNENSGYKTSYNPKDKNKK